MIHPTGGWMASLCFDMLCFAFHDNERMWRLSEGKSQGHTPFPRPFVADPFSRRAMVATEVFAPAPSDPQTTTWEFPGVQRTCACMCSQCWRFHDSCITIHIGPFSGIGSLPVWGMGGVWFAWLVFTFHFFCTLMRRGFRRRQRGPRQC